MFKQQEIEVLENLDFLVEHQDQSVSGDEIKDLINTNNKILSIIHLNINSIHANFDNFITFLEAYKLTNCDVIILTETYNILSSDQYNIPGYFVHYNNSKFNRNDGVIIFMKSNLNTEISDIKLEKSLVTLTRVCFKINNISFGITAAYRNHETDKVSFIDDIHKYFSEDINKQIEIFIGDININIRNHEDPIVNTYMSTLNHCGFLPYIHSPTRVTHETNSCIDHIFMRKKIKTKNLNCKSFIITSAVTDHYPVMLNLSLSNSTNVKQKIEHRKIEKTNDVKLIELMEEQDWNNVLNCNDAELATNLFVNAFLDTMEKSKVTITVNVKNYNKLKPWITNGIITSIKHRDKIKKKLLKNYITDLDNEYRRYRNNLNKTIHHAKNNYYKNEILKCENNIKTIYKVINDATNEKCNKSNSDIQIFDDNGKEFKNDKEMANFCNNFFTNVGVDMAKTIDTPHNTHNFTHNVNASMFLMPINNNELIEHINSLKNNSSPGIDGISSKIVKKIHTYILDPLRHIINLIFKTGVIPNQFKTTVVTPIHKTGSKTIVNNYRPISLINTFAKIFEKCLKDKLINFLNANKIMSKNQFGFTKGLSTCDAIYELVKQITDNLNNDDRCIAVFLDLAKAFDTVPHDTLLRVLSQYGVRGIVLDIFDNYLSDRQQMVKIRNDLSEPTQIKMGVPQGTVLGPILFCIYINSLAELDINASIISYADDTVVLFKGKTWAETKYKVICGINRVKDWLDTYKLSLNIKKTNYIAFSLTNANRPDFENIMIDNLHDVIKETRNTKYLGLTIDCFLKWEYHIQKLTNNIRKLIYKFYLLREFLERKLLLLIYKALVESLIRYGIIAWGGMYNNKIKQLNVVQNYILKIIFKRNKLYSTKLLYSNDILNVRSLYILTTCSYVHKCNKLKNYISHKYETRTKTNKHLQIPTSNRNINLRSINYLAPKFYNLLPLDIKETINKRKFNNKCRDYICNNYANFEIFF